MSDSPENAPSPFQPPVTRPPTHIVGVGASAGGLEALERMFQNMPTDTGMAFVIVQHLSPDFKSLMDELLARWTSLPIHRVDNGMVVDANSIYLLPPRKEMIISAGKLLLSDKDPEHGLSLPIDHFLRSLARECGPAAVAIILSGTGSDGSRGLEEIRNVGGLVIAQSVRSAKFDGMPNAARETGFVDLTLDPEEIGDALRDYVTSTDVRQFAAEHTHTVADEDSLSAIFRLLRDRYGLDFSHYKLNTVVRRTERRLQIVHVESIQEYAALVVNDTEELDTLYRDLLVGVTRFFRDPDAYQSLEQHVDAVIASKKPGSEFRTWIAGCATGEEAYSLAILLHERVQASGIPLTIRVFATDVHRRSLEIAGEAVYRPESLTEIPPQRVEQFFNRVDNGYALKQVIRQSVVLAQHNIIKDAPFTRMDLISCRNLLIYLQPPAQKKAISLFHFGLRAGGLLFLGPSESPAELDEEFDTLDGHWKIYRKRRDVRLPIELRISPNVSGRVVRASGLPEIPLSGSRSIDAMLLGTYDALLAEYMPPALLINQRHELLHVFGDAGRFLQHKSGRTGRNVLELMESHLRMAISGAIQQIHNKRKTEMKLRGIVVPTPTGTERIAVTVRSVVNQRTQSADLLILLEPMRENATAVIPPPDSSAVEIRDVVPHSPSAMEQIQGLEAELRYAKENLQATVEELETSNEELQASNEELVASNEELQSTNEELHSVNEELYTVNAEHQRKIHELTVLTDDMDNLLASTQVHTIFLDQELRIRKFTPQIAEVFSFVTSDLGRSFDSFSHRLLRDRLSAEVASVLDTGESLEAEVQDVSGHWFLMRILPYLTKGQLDGVVLTLIDIDSLKLAQQDLSRREFELRMIADRVPSLISCVDRNFRYSYVNQRYSEFFGKNADEIVGMTMPELLGENVFEEVRPHLEEALAGKSVEFEKRFVLPNGRQFWAMVSYSPDESGADGNICGLFVCKHLVTALKESEQRFERAVRGTTDGIWDWDIATGRVYCSPRFLEMVGLSANTTEMFKADVDLRIHAEDLPRVLTAEQALLRDGVPYDVEYRMQNRDGQYIWFRARAEVERCHDGRPTYVSGSVQNVETYRALVAEKEQQVTQRDRFLATLSHELRNPLGAVVNGCRVLTKVNGLVDEAFPVVDAISRQSQHMAALLEDLLDVARITEGKIEIRKKVFDLREVIAPAIESVQPLLDSRQQGLDVRLPDDPVPVVGNAVRLRQVATNLLSNASKYSPHGTRVTLELDKVDHHAELRVIDQGEGIPPALLRRVFEPFEQLGRTHDRTDGGLGLGLSLSQRLVQLHGGSIHAKSQGHGHGSEFVVIIPTIDAAKVDDELQPSRTTSGDKLRIVLVEDNADARTLLSRLLELEGYEICCAGTGPKGLELIQQSIPDVALVDVGLPGMDGYTIARTIRAQPELNSVYLVALTGYGQTSDRQNAKDAGFNIHFTKPVDLQELGKLLCQFEPSSPNAHSES